MLPLVAVFEEKRPEATLWSFTEDQGRSVLPFFFLRLRLGAAPFANLMVLVAELMLLGFISLLLTVFQDRIATICIPKRYSDDWLPCRKKKNDDSDSEESTSHFQTFFSSFTSVHGHGGRRQLLAQDDSASTTTYCGKQVNSPLPPTLPLPIFLSSHEKVNK